MKKPKKKVVIEDSKIDIEVKKKKTPTKASSFRIIKAIAIAVIIIAALYILTSTVQVKVLKNSTHSTTEDYTSAEPYTIIEEYEDRQPLGPPRCGNTVMNFSVTSPWLYFTGDGSVACAFNLTNNELKAGTWEYRAYFSGVTGNRYDKQTVEGGRTKTFNFYFEKNVGMGSGCEVSVVSIPSIERCYYPEETFYKIVTKTRNVTKYRNVTRPREIVVYNETTAVQSVNRFFGFPMLNFGW